MYLLYFRLPAHIYFVNIAIVLTRQTARFVGALFLLDEIFKLRERVNNFFDISRENQLMYNNILLLSNHGSALFFL